MIFDVAGMRIGRVLPPGSLRARFARGAFWATLASGLNGGFALVGSVFAARMLGSAKLGELSIIQNTVAMLAVFGTMGLGVVATKLIAEFNGSDPVRLGRVLGLCWLVTLTVSAVLALACFIGAGQVSVSILRAPHLITELRLTSLLVLLLAISGLQSAIIAGFESFKELAIGNLLKGLVSLPLLLGGIWIGGVTGGVLGLTLGALAGLLLNQVIVKRLLRDHNVAVSVRGIGTEWRIVPDLGVPALLSGVMVTPVIWVTNALLVAEPSGYEELGVFSAANQWRGFLLFLPGVAGTVAMPMLSTFLVSGDKRGFRKVLLGSLAISLTSAGVVAVLLVVFSEAIMAMHGSEFKGRGGVLAILALSLFLTAAAAPAGQLINAAGRMWAGFTMNLGWAVLLVAACAVFVKSGYGAAGLAWAYLVAYLAHALWSYVYARRTLCSMYDLGRPDAVIR